VPVLGRAERTTDLPVLGRSGENRPVAIKELRMVSSITQCSKSLFKQFRAASRNAVQLKKVRAFLVAAVVLAPCTVEAQFVDGAKVTLEFMGGGFMGGESLSQSLMQIVAAPVSEGVGINRGTESGGSGGKAGLMPVAPNKVSAKTSQKNGANDTGDVREDNFNH
jgi:hypothetical protein